MAGDSCSQRLSAKPDAQALRQLLREGAFARALEVIGDRWTLLVLRDAFLGVRRFEDFRRRTGAARGTLAIRLRHLVRQGILQQDRQSDLSRRMEYRLTDKGLGLYPVALCMWQWENRWGGEFGLPLRLFHTGCGKALSPSLGCAVCPEPLSARSLAYRVSVIPGSGNQPRRRRRRQGLPDHTANGQRTLLFHTVDTVGDHWTALLVGALMLGLHRHDDLREAVGLATNILADRLQRLLSAGVVEQRLYQTRPPRFEYRLTEKGLDLFPYSLALHEWASHWLTLSLDAGLLLTHRSCGHPLTTVLRCTNCGEALQAKDVSPARGSKR